MTRTAGYSTRTLVEKLGIKEGARIHIAGAPDGYLNVTLGPLPTGTTIVARLRGVFDLIQLFTDSQRRLARRVPALKRALKKDGCLWVSWPKRSSGLSTDVTEDVVRSTALRHGLVDVKVAAIDHVWSGLKLVYRVQDR